MVHYAQLVQDWIINLRRTYSTAVQKTPHRAPHTQYNHRPHAVVGSSTADSSRQRRSRKTNNLKLWQQTKRIDGRNRLYIAYCPGLIQYWIWTWFLAGNRGVCSTCKNYSQSLNNTSL